MTPEEVRAAAEICGAHGLPVTGLHFHLGSQFKEPAPLAEAIRLACELAKQIRLPDEWAFSPGGGWGVAYHEDDLPQPEIEAYVRCLAEAVTGACNAHALSLPHLHLEPGRSLIARAGVALYRLGAVKRRGPRTWLLVDGGLADNARPALYGARYTALPVAAPGRLPDEPATVAGPYCESGDVLIEDLLLPRLEPGELLAVPVSGAYQLSMSSNYNGARRPAVLLLDGRGVQSIQRRESPSDLLGRDLPLGK
jgi:diaminopimelate decarboxylase